MSKGLAEAHNLRPNTILTLRKLSQKNLENDFTAQKVEVTFKDQYVSRRDMWNFTQELEGFSIYKN